MQKRIYHIVLSLLFVLSLPAAVRSQDLNARLNAMIEANVKARLDQTDNSKQAESPAGSAKSTALVERSSSPDIAGLALNYFNLSDNGGKKDNNLPKTLNFSAYALKSMLSGEDALDPAVYNANRKWRSLSFTVGYESPEGVENDPSEREPVAGIKWLAYDRRDVSREDNQAALTQIESALGPAGRSYSLIRKEVMLYLFTVLSRETVGGVKRLEGARGTGDPEITFEIFENAVVEDDAKVNTLFASLTDKERKNVDEIISRYVSAFVKLRKTARDAVKTIRTRPQVALSFLTKQRKRGSPDEYKGDIIADMGWGRSNFTFNGGFLFKNSQTGKDHRGGSFAAELQIPLNPKLLEYETPVLFSLGGRGTGTTGERPTFVGQAKLSIPLAALFKNDARFAGMEFPISITVANRTELVNETTVQGRFGFTLDFARFIKALRDKYIPAPIESVAAPEP